jgi:hypothetical protein
MTQPEPWKGAAKRLARELGRAGWHVEAFGPDGRRFWHHASATSVIATRADHDGQEWLHASIAHPDRMPTWDELKALKVALVGAARFAYLVFPPAWQYVNQHPYALHLWARWDETDGAALPDFVGAWFAETGELSV